MLRFLIRVKAKKKDKWKSAYKSCFELAKKKKARTLAFPSLSTGDFSSDREYRQLKEATRFGLASVVRWIEKSVKKRNNPYYFDEIRFVISEESADPIIDLYKKELSNTMLLASDSISMDPHHMSNNIFWGSLPGSNLEIRFRKEKIEEKGDCGLHALGTGHDEWIKTLLIIAKDFKARESLWEEINQAFVTGKVKPPSDEWRKILNQNNVKKRKLDDFIRKMNESSPETEKKSQKVGSILEEKKRRFKETDEALHLYCCRKDVYKYYIESFSPNKRSLWLGYKSALLFAKTKQITLYIWEAMLGNGSKLQLKDYNIANHPQNTLHLFFSANSTHFDLLEDFSQSGLLLSQPTYSQPDVSNSAQRSLWKKASRSIEPQNKTFAKQEIFCGRLPESKLKVYFRKKRVRGDNNCGMTALGTTREEFVNALMDFAQDSEARESLYEEIYQAFVTDEVEPPSPGEWEELLNNNSNRQQESSSLIRNLRDNIEYASQFKGEETSDLIHWLKDNGKEEWAGKLQTKEIEVYQTEQALRRYCVSKEVYQHYVQSFLSDVKRLWVGYASALLFAKAKTITLYVWEAKRDGVKKLKLKVYTLANDPRNTIHMLHTAHSTHFDLFSVIENVKS